MSASALPGSRDDWYLAGMMATTETEFVVEAGPERETGGTANLTTAVARLGRRRHPTVVGLRGMTGTRLAAWVLGAAVCGAWLASAAGITRQARVERAAPRPADAVQFDALAADVQAQAGRLRERLAEAPAPREVQRNPFRFAPRAPVNRPVRSSAPPPIDVPEPIAVADVREPALQLIGVAEKNTRDGLVRTAMIAGGYDELMMVTAGQRILGRYEVVAVGADAVELRDGDTGAIRRLIMR